MGSAAAHWSPAVTELVQLVRTRWRENCFVGTKKRFQLCFETRGPRQMCDRLGALSAPDRDHSDHGGTWPVCLPSSTSKAAHRTPCYSSPSRPGLSRQHSLLVAEPLASPAWHGTGPGLAFVSGASNAAPDSPCPAGAPVLATPPLRDGAKDGVKRGAYYGSGER